MKYRLAAIIPVYLLVLAACYYTAYLLRFDFGISDDRIQQLMATLPIVVSIKLGLLLICGEWRSTFRYATLADLLYLSACSTVAAAICLGINLTLLADNMVPKGVILIDWTLTILAIGTLRSSWRVYREVLQPYLGSSTQSPTLIYGVDDAAIGILKTLQTSRREFRVIGFINDSPITRNSRISGIPVFSGKSNWRSFKRKYGAKHLLIPGTVAGRTVRDVLERCAEAGLKSSIIPAVNELVDGKYRLGVRDVTITDLLRRPPADLDMASIREYVAGRRVLVTGAAGSIGSEICRQALGYDPESLILLDQSEEGVFNIEREHHHLAKERALHFIVGDIGNHDTMSRVMAEYQPQLVFHAAAYKHVPLMELHPQEAIRNNVFGTKNIVDLAHEYGVERFVLISTDKAVRPSSVMGSTKLVAEKYVQSVASYSQTRFITVRFGNVLNSAGSVVPTFRKQIEAGGPITVTHPEMVRFFMTIPEAVQLVHQAGAIGDSGDVLILEMGEPVKIVDLARDMIFLSGLKYPDDIDIVFSGIRPGEKLYEELFYESEEGAKKVHDKIYCASRKSISASEVNYDIAKLSESLCGTRGDALTTLRKVVDRIVSGDQSAKPDLRRAA